MSANGSIDNRRPQCGTPCAVKCWKWNVTQVTMQQSAAALKYAVLILNRPISQHHSFVKRIWNGATVKMTVDGGTKQWDKYLNNMSEEVKKGIKLPDLITGDFDSITEEILEKYKKKGCKAIHTPDQDHTDFTKALMELNIHSNSIGVEIDHVLVFAQSSGRLDQTLGNIQTLFLARDKKLINPDTKVYLLSDDALSWLLSPGDHVITIPEETRSHKNSWCSLIPIGEVCQLATTTGLKWNLDNQPLMFGDIVSTSNTFDGSDKVTVKCSNTLLWSMRIPTVMGPEKSSH
ncbi:thiamine pyrophosphokinase 1 isoform X2 [Anticarsia gemmatalis]|uniref:thiamine pyrophosphokinase 1 isoform X2 n=1 Tax=Anticarsia gemmatalis TaxID=129554 RepID=UPI003F766E9F